MQGSDSYWLDLATSIQEQKYVYRTLSVLKSGTVFADCLKCHYSIFWRDGWMFDFRFVRKTFLDVRHSKSIKKSDIYVFGLAPYL